MSDTAFQRALDEYLKTVPSRKRKSKFILACYNSSVPVTPDSVNDAMQKAEEKLSQRGSRKILTKVMGPLISSLKSYFGIIDTLTSSSMPAAIVWGALKVIIVGVDRCVALFDNIKSQLRTLNVLIQRITEYEDIYYDSTALQDLLCKTYVQILRFWARVDRECDEYGIKTVLSMAKSFGTSKLDEIIHEIEKNATDIEKLAPIIEARLAKGEREDSRCERIQAGIERAEAQEERRLQMAWRETQQADRRNEHYIHISSWLDSREVIELNQKRHDMHQRHYCPVTCLWVSENTEFSAWQKNEKKPSVLWLNSPPGTGKSVLCSHAIQLVKTSDPSAAVAYLFYQFDHPYTAVETLRLLSAQLIMICLTRGDDLPEELYHKSQLTRSLENLTQFFTILIQQFTTVYLFLDGLDEEDAKERWTETSVALDFLLNLATTQSSIVRLWCSSQDRSLIKEKLGAYTTTSDFHRDMKEDVGRYLSAVKPNLQGWGIGDLSELLQKGHAGSFLWASLMVNTLREEASSPLEVKKLIAGNLPSTLDDYYRRIFARFEKFQRPLVRKLFSLVVFARRPLRLGEIREAIGMIDSAPSGALDQEAMPFPDRLQKLFSPLIELHPTEGNEHDPTCRLFHSTIKAFIQKVGGKVFDDPSADLVISPDLAARACLSYLRQPRYSQLLRRLVNGYWVDSSGDDVGTHQFLVYAAKYWDKHFDNVAGNSEIRNQITDFIMSSNFQTFIQVQSLWIENRFVTFGSDSGVQYLLRVFPVWFLRGIESTNERKLWACYRQFLHNWRHFLCCSNCGDFQCPSASCAGEIDRCWWSALGPRNFLSRFKGRYATFTLQEEESERSASDHLALAFEGIGVAGEKMVILQLVERDSCTLTFTCDIWTICSRQENPTLHTRNRISVHKDTSNWPLYSTELTPMAEKKCVGRAALAAFSSDCQFLRIGTQLFRLDDAGNYVPILTLNPGQNRYPAYIEEFDVRGQVTVVATRRHITLKDLRQTGVDDESILTFGSDFNAMEDANEVLPIGLDDDGWEDDSADGPEPSESYTSDSEQGNESWSEADTDYSADLDFADDLITPWARPVDDFDEDPSDGETSSDSSPEGDEVEDSDEGVCEPDLPWEAVVGYGRFYEEDGEHGINEDDGGAMYLAYAYGSMDPPTNLSSSSRSSIVVYLTDPSTDSLTTAYCFTRKLPVTLYSSPPVIHPSKPLVVWPIGRGDILFADFNLNTHYIRKLRPSTRYTAHISIQCHFSPCGSYLHMASFEGQRKPEKKKSTEKPPIRIALLVLTYRLSASKTSRSPPRMIHRTRIDLGWTTALSASKLPFTVTWTPDKVYVTCSDAALRVYRFNLFNTGKTPEEHDRCVSIPCKPFLLPSTAVRRQVHYFTSTAHDKARIIVGSEPRMKDGVRYITTDMHGYHAHHGSVFGLEGAPVPVSRPVGCFVDEDTDLGGWGPTPDCSVVPDDLGIGQLDRRLEKFDYDDDCDLEPYMI